MLVHRLNFQSMPSIRFAHRYGTGHYDVDLVPAWGIIEISYILRGCIHVDDGVNPTEIAPCDSVLTTVYDRKQHYSCPGEYHQHATVSFSADFLTESEGGLLLPQILPFKTSANPVRSLMEQLVLQYNLEPQSPQLIGMLFELMGMISNLYHSELQSEAAFGKEWYVNRAKQYIIENIEKSPHITDTAQFLELSPGYLSHIFTEMTGYTLTRFINIVRVRRIEELVLSYGMSVKQAGEQVGLYDPNYVSRLCKQVRGCTLSDLRHAKFRRIPERD